VSPFELALRSAQWNFVPASLAAARRLEVERREAEREAQPLPPFVEAQAELTSQVHRRQLEKRAEEREAAARRAVEG